MSMDPEESRENTGASEEKGENSVNKKSFEAIPIKQEDGDLLCSYLETQSMLTWRK